MNQVRFWSIMNVLYVSIIKVGTFKLINGKITDIWEFSLILECKVNIQGRLSQKLFKRLKKFTENKIIMCTLDKHQKPNQNP
jgi:hypothetical protein